MDEDEALSNDAHGYEKLGNTRPRTDFNADNGFANISPPADTYNIIYLSFVLGGVGFLLPYNSFIMAMDYFKIRYPSSPVVFDMSLVYIVVAFVTVLGNNLLVETFSLNTRINFGYVMSFITLIFVVVCEVAWEAFGNVTSYSVNLAAVAVVAVGCTVQQSSYYGYTSMLPSRYTQAVMVGESASGVFTSIVRVITRILIPELRGSTIYFFTVSASALATCLAVYHIIRRTDFIQFYVALCERAKTRITLEPSEDAGLIETTEGHYGVLKLQTSPPPTSSTLSFANPAYEPTAPLPPTYKVEDIVVRGSVSAPGLRAFRRGLAARWQVTKAVYPHMIAISLVYFATLTLYPGIASEVVSCRLGLWMPILMMSLFNGADLFGKMLAASARHWSAARLVRCAICRLAMVPLLVLCVLPRHSPLFSEMAAFAFSVMLGASNGVLGSLPMIQAPGRVEDRYRELTGNMMTLLYNFGLTAGSLMAYVIEHNMPPVEVHPCAPHVYQQLITTTTTRRYTENFTNTNSTLSTFTIDPTLVINSTIVSTHLFP